MSIGVVTDDVLKLHFRHTSGYYHLDSFFSQFPDLMQDLLFSGILDSAGVEDHHISMF